MLEYLMNYGVKRHTPNYEDLDVNDRLHLQDQINSCRKEYFELISLLDEVQGKITECSSLLSKRSKEIIVQSPGVRNNSAFATDDEYMELEAKLVALKSGASMINQQIDFVKSDLRILNSVFYNKF